MSPEKLAYMANQIARAFAYQGQQPAIASTADHIRKFWEARMRTAIMAQLDSETGSHLDPIVRAALMSLRSEKTIKKPVPAPSQEGDAKEGNDHELTCGDRTGAA